MLHLPQLNQVIKYPNSLAFLRSIFKTELGQCTLAMVNSLGLDKNNFQTSHYCSSSYCPIYSAAEILRPTHKNQIYYGKFIEQWKLMTNPQLFEKAQCREFFQDETDSYNNILVLPILLDLKVERWIIILKSEIDINQVDLGKLLLLANFAVVTLARSEEKKQLQEVTNWREKELQEIAHLQHLLLPEEGTSIPGIELAFKFQVYKEAGGDYFDISPLPKDGQSDRRPRFGGIIADVTGHGPSAAVEAAMLDAILRTFTPDESLNEDNPAAALGYVNTHFFTRKNRGKLVTALTFVYDPEFKMLRYACAGHPYGYIKRGDQIIRLDKSTDIPIGVLKEYQWTYHDVAILPHDIIFVYTDVVLETRNKQQQEFGFERLEATIKATEHCPHCLVDNVAKALTEFSGSDEFTDDLTLCAIEIFP